METYQITGQERFDLRIGGTYHLTATLLDIDPRVTKAAHYSSLDFTSKSWYRERSDRIMRSIPYWLETSCIYSPWAIIRVQTKQSLQEHYIYSFQTKESQPTDHHEKHRLTAHHAHLHAKRRIHFSQTGQARLILDMHQDDYGLGAGFRISRDE